MSDAYLKEAAFDMQRITSGLAALISARKELRDYDENKSDSSAEFMGRCQDMRS